MDQLIAGFKNPPMAYRSAPLWVWNDLMSEEIISFQLNELKTHGFGGAFVHPRPGLITEYLSEEWFRMWDFALGTAKSLGMKLYIYDENSYPSGFAGGHVSSQLPDCLATGMIYQVVSDVGRIDWGKSVIKAFVCSQKNDRLLIEEDITLYPMLEWANHGNQFFVIQMVKPQTTGWLAGFSYVDIMRPEVTELFLQTTYEAYYRRFGKDFGGDIPAIFTDEPYISNSGVYDAINSALPFSYWMVNEFETQHGYSLLDNLPCVLKNVEGNLFDYPAEKVRYDYYTTLHTLWTQNFVMPMGKWCEEHKISWTGHYMEHQWPFAYGTCAISPAIQSNYEYHQWPAIDMLLSNHLRETESHALMLTIQEVRSASNQFKKERTLCELYGAGGWDSTFEDYKRMADWVMVNGINFINQHLTYSTISGARKRDHPQSFDWREPWWDEYTQMNDYLGRTSYLLSQGVMKQRILILNPSTTGYLIPYEEERGPIFTNAGLDAIQNPDMSLMLEIIQCLTDQQWDYDLGDEYTLQRHATVEDGKLRVCEQHYEVVIVPGSMKNMLKSTADVLGKLLETEGCVLACGDPGSYIDGLLDESVYEALCSRWTSVKSANELHTLLLSLLPIRIESSVPWVTGVAHMRREMEGDREIYFFVNHNMDEFRTTITLPGKSISKLNLFNGKAEPVRYESKGDKVCCRLSLKRNQSAMFVTGMDAEEKVKPVCAANKEIPLSLVSILQESPNVIPISYCDLKVSSKTYENIYVLKAADILFNARGFGGNPWDNKVQYRNNLMQRNHYGPSSGFEAVYSFTLEKDFIPKTLYVAAEQPTICRLLINGYLTEWLKDKYFLDHHIGVADISAHVHPGINNISVFVERFDVCMELETVYLYGDYSVINADCKWILTPPQSMQYGSWKSQGRPFYSGAMIYQYEAQISDIPQTALFNIKQYKATALSLNVNGQNAGLFGADGADAVEIADLLHTGKNQITIRVCGSLKNLLGPHFMKNPVRGSAWPAMWKDDAPVFSQPEPDSYDLLDFGLTKTPTLSIGIMKDL